MPQRWRWVGFCLVCFAAVAAFHAVETLGCGRVAVMDFDVHHGNGVAALVKGDERVRYRSRDVIRFRLVEVAASAV